MVSENITHLRFNSKSLSNMSQSLTQLRIIYTYYPILSKNDHSTKLIIYLYIYIYIKIQKLLNFPYPWANNIQHSIT